VPDVSFSETVVLSPEDDNSLYITEFLSFEELSRAALFPVKELSYLPDKLKFQSAGIQLYEDGSLSYDVSSTYVCSDSLKMLWFFEQYVGSDAYLDLQVIDGFSISGFRAATRLETARVNNAEALLSITTFSGEAAHQNDLISLTWIQNDVAYMLSSHDYDIETMIAIAKSV